jgi:predicted RNA-binding Zn ribbon-like protein
MNRDQWVELARTTSHLNQLVRQLVRTVHSGPVAAIPAELPDLLRALRTELYATRQALLGKRPDGRDLPSLNKTLNEAPIA